MTFFFAATFVADEAYFAGFAEGFFAGFADLVGDFLVAVLFGAAFACVFVFDFFFEPAMVAISDPGSLADPHAYRDEKCYPSRHFQRPTPADWVATELGERRFGAEAAGRAVAEPPQ